MSNESPEPYIRNDRHAMAHVRAEGYFMYHPPERLHSDIRRFPDHPVKHDREGRNPAHWTYQT